MNVRGGRRAGGSRKGLTFSSSTHNKLGEVEFLLIISPQHLVMSERLKDQRTTIEHMSVCTKITPTRIVSLIKFYA